MEEKLDFSLPEKNPRGSLAGPLAGLLLAAVAILTAANTYILTTQRDAAELAVSPGLSASQAKQLATKLSQRDLHEQAAAVWAEYLQSPNLSPQDRAHALFQIGLLYEKAGRYGQAIEHFYRSEMAAPLEELASQINTHIKSCFEQRGAFSALRYELMDRTSVDKTATAGQTVVAEIGPEKITDADLDAMIENAVENQLAPMTPFMTAEQAAQEKQGMLSRFKTPQTRLQFLQSRLAEEVLYRQALTESLPDKPRVKQLLTDVSRGVLSSQLMNEQLAAKISITETDVQTFYEANKSQYIAPATARISHILLDGHQKALDAIGRAKSGEGFAELAKAISQDSTTKDYGGAIDADLVRGRYIPVIGDANGLEEAIFAAKPGEVLPEPYQSDKGWHVVQLRELTEARQRTFDEVRQDVMMTLMERKRQDVQQQFIK
ncbi:MAG TPA: hypothetical protein ENN81_00330, partial [Phycisphaerales bacterium]|nr:hypothetical protein [Phycisphaerales bacterium]